MATFGVMLLLFIPIGITANLAEKIDSILEKDVPLKEVLVYYVDFTIFFANLLFPILLFLSIIWFTSKLASNTEIIAFLSSGVSFWRFLRPYTIGATLVCIGALALSTYIAPEATKGYYKFKYKYLSSDQVVQTEDLFRQVTDHDVIYAAYYEPDENKARNFILEHFEAGKMTFRIKATSLRFHPEDSTYTLLNYQKRIIGPQRDYLMSQSRKDTVLPFKFDALAPVSYIAETLNYFELKEFIQKQEARGASNINRYKVAAYKRWSVPVSAFILTLIAVSVSAMKRRGGMGVNLAIGIAVAFLYVFLDKIFGTIAEQSTFSPWLAVWIPNIFFGILGVILLWRAKR